MTYVERLLKSATCYGICCGEGFFECLRSANPNDNVDLARCEYEYCDIGCLEKCEETLRKT